MNKLKIFLFAAVLPVCLINCDNKNKNGNNSGNIEYNPDEVDSVNLSEYGLTDDFILRFDTVAIEDVGDMIQSFPSPVETSALIQNMKVPYNYKFLFDTDASENFVSNFQKALGLGIYCADLGYLNVYNKTGDVIEYLVTIRKLSDDLKIGQFFDFQALKRIATNNNNLDSLLILSVQSYFNMDTYLRQNDRSNLSALMVTGVWLESLYLATQVYKEKENKQMCEYIAGQKHILESLMAILVKFMNNERDYVRLVGNLKDLVAAMEPVVIETVGGTDVVENIEGQQTTTQGEHTVITVSKKDIDFIVATVGKIRNQVALSL